MKIPVVLSGMLLALSLAAGSFAQGVQTGTIRGVVRDDQSLPVPGVTVTVTSPGLQGPRSMVTETDGGYVFRTLPPGDYEVVFELSGFAPVTRATSLPLGLTIEQNVTMRAAGVTEAVEVVAEAPAPIVSPIVGQNFKQAEIEALATPRTLQGIATLSPGLTERSPNTGQLVINGAFAFDNVFMVNGVDVNDNLFANPQSLFIEDAIQETQVLTSGISAEYGRFSGGVINAITKSGSNSFSGSWRLNLLNPAWTTETPFEVSRSTVYPDTLQKTQEATFGGPIVRDRLWFFLSGRYGSVDSTVNLPQTGVQLISNDLNKRGELKLTGTVVQNHTLQGGYLNNARARTNNSGLQSYVIDPFSEVNRTNPNWYSFANYNGVLSNNLLVSAQYSERRFKFADDGGTSTNILDSPIFSLQCACVYNAPYFDATDPENRNNKQFTGSATSFWSAGGRHETKGGYEFFRSHRTGGNSQSSTSYVYNADFAADASGKPLLDSSGRLIPMFVPGDSYLEFYPATRGATMHVNNHSAYLQDHWAINSRWSADLGLRFEKVRVISTGDIISVDTQRIVPRLALARDVRGNGDHIVHLTYSQYSGRYNEAQVGGNSPVGNPAYIFSIYQGPAGQARSFAPGFDIRNYPITPDNASVQVPTANVFTDPDLKSALTHEFTTSYGVNLGSGRGYAEASYVYRKTTSLVEAFQTRADGTTHVVAYGVDAGFVSNVVYRNTDLANRQYQGMVFQARYRLGNSLTVNGHHTLQLKNDGNYEGEGTNTPGSDSWIGDYPEAFNAARHYPDGRLQNFQKHRMRIWGVYTLDMGRAGDASVSGLWRVDSGLAFSFAARNQAITAQQRALLAAAGYPDLPSSSGHHVFFAERGSEVFPGYGLFDTSFNYNVPVFKSLRPWVKFDVYNLLNNQKLVAWSTTVSQNAASGRDNLGLTNGYTQASTYGTATGNTVTNVNTTAIPAYPQWVGGNNGGRTFRVAMGFRF